MRSTAKGPYRVLASRTIYHNEWVQLREDEVRHPDGSQGTFGVLEMRPGVVVLVLAAEQHCYLVREYKYGIERESLEAVGGATEAHEQPLDAAKREVKEELGVEATDWIALGAIDHFATAVRSPTSLFLARSVKEGKQALDAGERVQVVKLHFAQVLEMVMSGEITHGPSCVLILKADRYLRQLKEEGSWGTEK